MSQAERLVALTQGTRIGSYEVLAPLGAGGMGEVYRARDTKLNRDVALKVLPDLVANDPERMARFQREAEVLASLNHPNIGQIHGLEEADGVRALVLELIEGPTLEDVIARGPMRVEEALPVARQIAAALEAAHEAGVVHRDLKPANVKVRDDGAVKVLDFGLAKALQGDAGDPSMSPTITAMGTQAGVIMGTVAYMAPEQAKGKPVDKRADIWAFGAVLFEMLTGRRAFEGDDVSEVLASVLAREPRLEAVPTTVPTSVRRLLARCLVKDPAKRLRDIGDARVELSEAATAETAAGSANTAVAGGWRLTALVGAVALVVGSASTALLVPSLTRPDPPPVSRFLVMPSADAPLTTRPPGASVAMSPDGSTLAYLFDDDGRSGLAVRRVDQVEARLLDGRRLAEPFFSPDGLSLGFVSFQLSALQRVDLTNASSGRSPGYHSPRRRWPPGVTTGPSSLVSWAGPNRSDCIAWRPQVVTRHGFSNPNRIRLRSSSPRSCFRRGEASSSRRWADRKAIGSSGSSRKPENGACSSTVAREADTCRPATFSTRTTASSTR